MHIVMIILIVLAVCSVYIVAEVLSIILFTVFGNNPLGRLLKVLGFIGGGGGYLLNVLISEPTIGKMLLLLLAPISFLLLLAIVKYIVSGN